MRILSFFLLLFGGMPAMAAVAITAISGASSSSLAGTGATATIIGGTAGEDCGAINGNGSTCNSCDTTVVPVPTACTTQPLCACNATRIYDTGQVHITVKKDGNAKGPVRIARSSDSFTLTAVNSRDDGVDIEWQQLCAAASTTCANAAGTVALKVYADGNNDGTFQSGTDEAIDLSLKFVNVTAGTYDVFGAANSDGINDFTPYPGDEKIYFEDPQASGTYSTVAGGKIRAIRVYHTEKGLDVMTPSDASSDLTVDTDGKTTSNVVTGLENDTTYVFRISLLDEANNVLQFFPGNGTDANCDSGAAGGGFANCPWAATPEKVLGLLTDDFNCFIATAAYGSALEPKLDTFREFRFKILLQHQWGRKFVLWYYKYGSMAARFISDKPTMRAGVQVFLYPAYWFTKGSLKFGFFTTLAFTLVLLSLCSVLLWISSRRIFGQR